MVKITEKNLKDINYGKWKMYEFLYKLSDIKLFFLDLFIIIVIIAAIVFYVKKVKKE